MEQLNVQLNRLTRSLRRARTVELPEGEQIRFRILFIHLFVSEKYRNIRPSTASPLPFVNSGMIFLRLLPSTTKTNSVFGRRKGIIKKDLLF